MTRDGKPLDGLRVVEFGQVIAGPFCAQLLADLGATVLKVEAPGGDSLRGARPLVGGDSVSFASANRGKASVVLDLKYQADRDIARRLVLDSDVLVENNRPGVMDRLGMGWEWFRSRKPSLVYCSVSAYGQNGPRAAEGGLDIVIQARAGLMSITGEPERPPARVGFAVCDFVAGLYAALTIVSVVQQARAEGVGGHIDVPMFAAALAVEAMQAGEFLATGASPPRVGSANTLAAPYQAFRAADDWFVVAVSNEGLWKRFCEVLQLPDLATHDSFSAHATRAANRHELAQLVEPLFLQASAEEWVSRLSEAGVPAAPINDVGQALGDPQAVHLALVREVSLPGGGRADVIGCPVRIDDRALEPSGVIPPLDGHAHLLDAYRQMPSTAGFTHAAEGTSER